MTEAWADHACKALRAACRTADGASLLVLLRRHDLGDVLQECGDVLGGPYREARPVPGGRRPDAPVGAGPAGP